MIQSGYSSLVLRTVMNLTQFAAVLEGFMQTFVLEALDTKSLRPRLRPMN